MNINRRDFLSTSALASGSLLARSRKRPFQMPADFTITILATNWGFQGSTNAFCAKAKESGYDGIEVWYPMEEKVRTELMAALEKYDLKYGFLVGGRSDDFETNFEEFKQQTDAAAAARPLFLNCHSGKDYFSFEQNSQFIDYTLEVEQKTGIPIYHETHRGKILFNAPLTSRFLQDYPELRLTLDISHWCVVHTSLLHNQKEAVTLALSRTEHIHSRVGHSQSPQVSDPRAPEWSKAVDTHFAWWDQVIENKIKRGDKSLTMTTEFGPPHYMPALPYTGQAVANLWAVNTHMKDLWRERYA
ncbi:MAG: TIM barrel protein [Bacteroidota bacterium]